MQNKALVTIGKWDLVTSVIKLFTNIRLDADKRTEPMKKLIWTSLPMFLLMIMIGCAGALGPHDFGFVEPGVFGSKDSIEIPAGGARILVDVAKNEFENSSNGWHLVTTHHVRKHIMSEAGKEHANISISSWNEEKVSGIEAWTILPDGTKLKVKGSEIYSEGEKGKRTYKKFTFPGVTENCVVEYTYQSVSPYLHNLNWFFQDNIPTVHSSVEFVVPAQFVYSVNIRNAPDASVEPIVTELYLPDGKTYASYVWSFDNLPAIPDENYMTTPRDYMVELRFQITEFRTPYMRIPFGKTWDDVWDEYLKVHYQPFFNLPNSVITLAAELVGDKYDLSSRVEALYAYVRDSIETGEATMWDYQGYTKTLNKGWTSANEKNLLLMGLLRALGYDAYPLMISTRSNGLASRYTPNLSDFNRIIVGLKTGRQIRCYDTESRFAPADLLPPEDFADFGMLITPEGLNAVDLPAPKKLRAQTVTGDAYFNDEGALVADLIIRLEGYAGRSARYYADEADSIEGYVRDRFFDEDDDIDISNIEVSGMDEYSAPFQIKARVTFNNMEGFGEEMFYFNLPYLTGMDENPLRMPTRSFPVDFNYPRIYSEQWTLSIPEGYSLEELPTPRSGSLGKIRFTRVAGQEGQTLKIDRQFKIAERQVAAKQYIRLKELFGRIVQADQEPIVFVKE